MNSATYVLAILNKLQFLSFCTDLKIPDAAASDPSKMFDDVLATFLRETYPRGREAPPLPVALGGGRHVDLLRFFAAVRAVGGYAAVSSSTGLDAALAAPVKLLYTKYLGALDRWIRRLLEAHGPFLGGNGRKKPELFFEDNGREKEKPFLGCNEREQQHAVLKRKWVDMVGMLDWVRGLVENAWDGGTLATESADGYFSMALVVREAVSGKRVHQASMANGTLLQEIFPMVCK